MSDAKRRIFEESKIFGDSPQDLSSLINIVLRDDLTELYNRRYFRQRLEEERKRVDSDNASLAIIMIDVDDLKLINDTLGHLKGDDVLVRVGKLISSSVRSIDIVCRYAGDEFVVILPSAGRREAGKITRRILKSILGYNWEAELGSGRARVSLSLGYASYPRESRSLEGLIQKADMELYAAKRKKDSATPAKKAEHLQGLHFQLNESVSKPFLERKDEMAVLKELFGRVRSGEPAFVLVKGPPGSGKTRLLQEFDRKIKRFKVLRCRGIATVGTKNMPLFPIREALGFIHRHYPSEFHTACGELDRSSLKHLSRFLPPGILEPPPEDEIPSERYQVFGALYSIINVICRFTPSVFLIEDLEWADEGTLEFLSFLEENIAESRLMIVATMRSDFSSFSGIAIEEEENNPACDGHIDWQSITLKYMSEHSTGRLIRHYLGMKRVSSVLTRDLYRITEGNPVFLKETLVYLVQHNMIDNAMKKGIDYDAAGAVLPQGIQEMIKGRFRELKPSVQRMLQAAAVLGYNFQVAYLQAILKEKEGNVYDWLDDARRENFIKENFVEGAEFFSFRNTLLRDLIYHEMNRRKRKFYHLEIGRILEKEAHLEDAAALGKLATHFENGGRGEKAFRYLVMAGEKARKLYASTESINYLERALNLSALCGPEIIEPGELIRVREVLGDLLGNVGRNDESRKVYTHLLGTDGLDESIRIRILRKIGEVHSLECKYDKALTSLYKALNTLASKEGPEYQNIVMALSSVFTKKGESDKALHYSVRLLNMPGVKGGDLLSAKIFFIIGSCHLSKGYAKEALTYFKKSLTIRERSDDLMAIGSTFLNIGNALYQMGRKKAASQYWEKSVKLGQKTGNAYLEMAARNNVILCFYNLQDPEKTLSSLGEVHRLAKRMGNLSGVASCRNNMGAVKRETGNLDKAVIDFTRCMELSEKMDNLDLIAMSTINLGTVHVDIGDLEKAENYAWKTLEFTTKNKMKKEEGRAWDLLGDVNYWRKKYDWAVDNYHRAEKCFEGFILESDGVKMLTRLKLIESSCLSDDTGGWKRNLVRGLSDLKGKKKELMWQVRVRKATVLMNKGEDSQEVISLLRKALDGVGRESARRMDLWHVSSLLVKAHSKNGSLGEAEDIIQFATSLLLYIRRQNRDPGTIRTFFRREDVREFLALRRMQKTKI